MASIQITAFDLAQRYIGITELGKGDHPLIQWWHSLCGLGTDAADEIPWCASFCNGIAWELRLPRSKSAAARSWLAVGRPIMLSEATPAFDVVILKRGAGEQPGPEVLAAPGHVGFFAACEGDKVVMLGGNQSNAVNISRFPVERILGIRRLL